MRERNSNLPCFHCATLFISCSGLRVTWGELADSISQDGSCLWVMCRICFGDLKLRDMRVPTGGRFFFFFSQFWGCLDCRRRVSQVDEADNYAWTHDTVKMSFDPGHLACSYVSVINILSFGIPQKGSSGATPLVSNSLHVACAVWKCWLEWQEKPRWLRSMELLLSLFSENLQGQHRVLVDFCVGGYLT